MNDNIEYKVVAISGERRGLGEATARHLAVKGAAGVRDRDGQLPCRAQLEKLYLPQGRYRRGTLPQE